MRKKTKLANICDLIDEKILLNKIINHNLFKMNYISTENMLPDKNGIIPPKSIPSIGKGCKYKTNDTLLSNIRPYFKKIWLAKNEGACSNDVLIFRAKESYYHDFLYYNLANDAFFEYAMKTSKGTKMPRGDKTAIKQYDIYDFDYRTQQKLTKLLRLLDDKIELNRQINTNLEQQVLAYYNYLFIDNYNVNRRKCRMNEYFDISIGKTPPRQETQWFKTQSNDVVWVSISDMAKCGLYINKSSEQLTKEAIKKFNIPVVPDNTLLLSFKLTIGRIAITNGALVTNEAIAHFKTDQKIINEYLYCYLKRFDYYKMGNTSSIAVALNSRLIKEMPFIIPESHELQTFYDYAHCRFQYIKANLSEINTLSTLRDALLPKLMSGEIDVSRIELE